MGMKANTTRSKLLDIIKAVCLLSVLLYHALQHFLPGILLISILGSFQMPMFFLVSGYFMYGSFRHHPVARHLIKTKTFQLLVPHFVANFVYYFIAFTGITAFLEFKPSFSLGTWLLLTFFNYGEWFLFTLFSTFLLLILVIHPLEQRLPARRFIVASGLVAVALVFLPAGVYTFSTTLSNVSNVDFLRFGEFQYYSGFAILGFLLAKFRLKTTVKIQLIALPILLIFFCASMIATDGIAGGGYLCCAHYL